MYMNLFGGTNPNDVLIFCPSDRDDGAFIANMIAKEYGCSAFLQKDLKLAKESAISRYDCVLTIESGENKAEMEFVKWLAGRGKSVVVTKNEAMGMYADVFEIGMRCCFSQKGYSKFFMSECMDAMFKAEGDGLWHERRGSVLKDCCGRILAEGRSRLPLLVTGEQGSGKQSVPQIMHKHSPRKGKFVQANCASFREEDAARVEMLLKGDARKNHVYLSIQQMLAKSNGGTLFFNQVDMLPVPLQTYLAETLESGKFFDMKTRRCRKYNGRVIFTTLEDRIEEKVMKGHFSEKLYRFMSQSVMRMPSIVEYKEDIVPLAEAFIDEICKGKGYATPSLTQSAKDKISRHIWVGNLWELYSALSASCAFGKAKAIDADSIFLMEPIGHLRVERVDEDGKEEEQSDARQCV